MCVYYMHVCITLQTKKIINLVSLVNYFYKFFPDKLYICLFFLSIMYNINTEFL